MGLRCFSKSDTNTNHTRKTHFRVTHIFWSRTEPEMFFNKLRNPVHRKKVSGRSDLSEKYLFRGIERIGTVRFGKSNVFPPTAYPCAVLRYRRD